eukprot:TCALIF_10047-PA protein Name:"Similar to GLCAK2 Probable glucuronokinase 2 (Arabidopsis thaliana)" AED:0.09 eAED:0.09 QI:195/0.5/0.6/1/0.75/0.8/5/28/500
MICVLLVAGHQPQLDWDVKQDISGRYVHLEGVPKALLPGVGGKKILDSWWELIKHRQIFNELCLKVKKIRNQPIMVIAGDILFQDQKFDLAQVTNFHGTKADGDLAIYYELGNDERIETRGIIEVCPFTNRIVKFWEKPSPDQTISRNASVPFYCFQPDTIAKIDEYLSMFPGRHDLCFGDLLSWLVNDKDHLIYAMKLPSGFQLIGQTTLEDYDAWIQYFTQQEKNDVRTRRISKRAYARVGATCKKFYHFCSTRGIALGKRNFSLKYDTNIPRQVGLAGSSAIVTATLKCLMAFFRITEKDIPKDIQPQFIMEVEVSELFINAGLQDRVVQVYEGLVFMDFDKDLMGSQGFGLYENLSVQDLPSFFICYSSNGSDSGKIHSDVRKRFDQGDPEVVNAMEAFAELTKKAKRAVQDGNWPCIAQLMKDNFALRRSIYGDTCLGADNIKMVDIGCRFGAACKFPGSGGAVVGLLLDHSRWEEMKSTYEEEGFVFVRVIPNV